MGVVLKKRIVNWRCVVVGARRLKRAIDSQTARIVLVSERHEQQYIYLLKLMPVQSDMMPCALSRRGLIRTIVLAL